MKFLKYGILAACLTLSSAGFAVDADYDVVVVGGGTGGCSAAIQAARMGAKVAIVEDTDWLGGQMTSCGVTSLDDLRRNRTGLYGEYLQNVRKFYKDKGENSAICYWGGDTTSGSADILESILKTMVHDAGVNQIYLNTLVTKVDEQNGSVQGLWVENEQGQSYLKSKVLIDASEDGYVLPMTTARYRLGKSVSPEINPADTIQDLTWVMPIHKVQGTIPEELKAQEPQFYKDMEKRYFSPIVTANGHKWPGQKPYDRDSFNAYRAIPDFDFDLKVKGDVPKTWQNITATSLNWGNDYPGRIPQCPGLKAKYFLDSTYRKNANRDAILRTIGLLRYYQTALNGSDWTVDTRVGYAQRNHDFAKQVAPLPEWAAKIALHMPPRPYLRESRRLVGLYTLTAKDIYRDPTWDRAKVRFTDAIAVGEYPIDVHGSKVYWTLEKNLGESISDFPPKWHAGKFQIPLRILIPEKVNGLLACEKNLSVSRLVNGATRLHPVTMLTGQAAGALAALSAAYDVPSREVPEVLVQKALLESGSMLAQQVFDDLKPTDPTWPQAQFISIVALDPFSKHYFGYDLPLLEKHLSQMADRLQVSEQFSRRFEGWVSQQRLGDFLKARFGDLMTDQNLQSQDKIATRGELAQYFYELSIAEAEKKLGAHPLTD